MSTEILTWHRPDAGQFPDADQEVLLRTDDDDYPLELGSYEGDDVWCDRKRRLVRGRVIEWSLPVGSVPIA